MLLFLQSGKTWVSNFLAEATESSGGEYHPTQGVRILEFESEGEDPRKGTLFRAEVELWDCSGSRRYSKYHSLICHGPALSSKKCENVYCIPPIILVCVC